MQEFILVLSDDSLFSIIGQMSAIKEAIRDNIYGSIPERARYSVQAILHEVGVNEVRYNWDAITSVDVGIDSWCNRSCGYCNLSLAPDQHTSKGTAMPQETWCKVLSSLGRIDYKGDLQAVYLNEPLLTAERTLAFYDDAARLVPNARLILFTNGDLLPKYSDQIAARNLEVHLGIHNPVNRRTIEFLEGPDGKRINISRINDCRTKPLEWRTPSVPKDQVVHPRTCWNYIMRRRNLVSITPDGDVQCCPHQTHQGEKETRIWGNINNTDLLEIYRQFEFWQFREQRRLGLTEGMRQMCRDCTGR